MEPEDMIEDLIEGAEIIEVEADEIIDGPEPMTRLQVEGIVQNAIEDAVDFIESEISDERIKAQRYYDGEVDIGYEDGRSKVVATKVRDTIRAVKPSLMRIFLSSSKPVEYTPKGPEDVAAAEQATSYMHYEFNRQNGYRVLNDAFHDALVKKQGIVKAYWLMTPIAKIYTYSDLSDDEFTYLVADDGVTVLEHSVEYIATMDPMGMQVEAPVHSVKISREEESGELRVESVPPEEFFIDRNARNLEDAYVVAHRTDMRVGDLIAMGYDPDVVSNLDSFDAGSEVTEAEVFARRGYAEDYSDEDAQDPSMKNVTVTEAYMRIDADGTGIPVLHRITCGGTAYEMLDYEPADEIPFAKFEVDPEPHTFYGRSLAEIIIDDQDAATSILRGILDNVAMTNNPRIAVTEGAVNMDDVLNNEIGAVVRQRTPGAVQTLAVPFVAGQTLSALSYMDGLVETKTGVTRASMGLDPDAMQSTTKSAVTATVQAAAGQVEVMVRNLADGMKDLFGIMLRLMVKNVDEDQMMRLNGAFVPIDPRVWDTGMDVSINVGLGTGREEERAMAYREVLGLQRQVYAEYGPSNGVVSLVNIRNTLSDMMAASGIRNSDRYFQPITPEYEQQLMQQAQQAAQAKSQQGPQDPQAMAFMQAEQMKAQTRAQTDAMKVQLDAQKAIMDDDRKRDEMYQDLVLKNAELEGKFGLQANEQQIKAEQERQRMMMGQGR
jgi:hypothetical protein